MQLQLQARLLLEIGIRASTMILKHVFSGSQIDFMGFAL